MSQKSHIPLPSPRIEVRLAGSGGQGLILAGLVLAEAAGVFDGREVAMVQSYGPEARGGASKADTYSWDLKPGAWVLIDKDLVLHPPSSKAIALPFTAVARDKLKRIMVANVVALGAISELTSLVTRRALEKSLLTRVPSGSEELNKKALSLGAKLARQYGGKQGVEDEQEPESEA
jgi:2-oxoglutarate ferredoxin oxidoreductase subunit gamma